MSWERMSKIIDRYEKLSLNQIRDLKQLQKIVIERSNQDNVTVREQIQSLEEHLLNGLAQLFSSRNNLEDEFHDLFDQRLEPIRSQIQSTVAINKTLPSLNLKGNDVYDSFKELDNPYEFESKRYARQSLSEMKFMEDQIKEAKEKAEATSRLEQDMHALEDIMVELHTLVYQQNEVIDSIEEHVERANHDVQRGNNQLKRAVQHKAAKLPLLTAVAGGVALGGPVGFFAGSAIAGLTASVLGAVVGVFGGKHVKRAATEN
ncbi:unnamed protein product [Auanema sp. JU1783]|nr:unnamed protein product [Auanema sp. JU1783]